jgi:hypothetical protein
VEKNCIHIISRIKYVVFSLMLVVAIVGSVTISPSIALMQEPISDDTVVSPAQNQHNVTVVEEQAVTHKLWLPIIDSNSCTGFRNRAKNHFGVQVYGQRGLQTAYYCELVASGATWVRNEASWQSAEPTDISPPEYRWQTIDGVVETAAQGGFNLILTINYNPSWAATYSQGTIDKVPVQRLAAFVAALVERYDGDGINDAPGSPIVEHFELYNEPDAWIARPNDIRWGKSGKQYAEMLAAVYPAAKAANPNAKILLGGIAYDWFIEHDGPFVRTFLDDVLQNGGGAHFDIMNFHQYPPFAANWGAPNGPGLVEKTKAVRQKLAEYNLQKPIFITESGMHSNSPESPERQARYVTMLYTQALVANVNSLIWFMLYDPGESYPYRNGLITYVDSSNPRPQRKPAFVAYQTAASKLTGAQFERAFTSEETKDMDMVVYKFVDKDNEQLFVAWLGPISRTDSKLLKLPGTSAMVSDIYGVTRTVQDGDDGQVDGSITLSVGAQPVYVHIHP